MITLSLPAQLLWKISGNGMKKDSYVLGTFHLVPASAMNMITGLDEALENCDIVVGESDYKEQKPTEGTKWYELPADSTLDQLYTAEEYQTVKNRLYQLAGTEFDLGPINRCKPMRVFFEMTKMIALGNYTTSNIDDLIDFGVMKRAVEMGRESMGLDVQENVNALLVDLISEQSVSEQAQILLAMCQNEAIFDEIRQMILNKIEAYMTQELDLVASAEDAQDEALVINRNLQWMTKLVQVMADKSCLVCVGAAHLPGDKGLLQLMRNEGYTVEPMK